MRKDERYESQSTPTMILWVGKCRETGNILSEQRRRILLGMHESCESAALEWGIPR